MSVSPVDVGWVGDRLSPRYRAAGSALVTVTSETSRMACVTQTRATLSPGGPEWPHAFHGCVEKLLVNQRDLKPLPKRSFFSQNNSPWSLVPGAARHRDLSLSLGGEEQGQNVDFFLVLCRVPACCVLGSCLLCPLSFDVFSPKSFQTCRSAPQHALHSLRAVRAKRPWLDTSVSPALFARARAFALPLSPFHSRWDG